MITNVVRKTGGKPTPKSNAVSSAANDNRAGFQNVKRELQAANDNQSPERPYSYGISKVNKAWRQENSPSSFNSKVTRGAVSRLLRPQNNNRLQSAKVAPVKEVASTAVDVANAASAAWFIVGTTWIFYMVQFVAGVISLVGLLGLIAIQESWLSYADFFGFFSGMGEAATYTGMVICAAMGVFTLILAIIVFKFRGVAIARSHSVPLMALCFALNVAPGFNLFPWFWVWCLFVVKSQVGKG